LQIPSYTRPSQARSIAKWYLLVLLSASILYVATCAPAILWQDSGLFVYRIWHNDIEGNLGIALAHPLYILIGIAVKWLPFGDLAHRVNLISSIAGALAVANLFLLLRLWVGRVLPALLGAITLMVSWTFWQHAVIAETYTLAAAQIFAELIVLLMYTRTKKVGYLYLLGLLNGLTIANHLWALLGLLCYAVYVIVLLAHSRLRWRHVVVIVLLWMVGAAPYEYLIVKSIVQSGDVAGTFASALFGTIWQGRVLNTTVTGRLVLENLAFVLLNFPTPNILLFFVGFWVLGRVTSSRAFANIVLAMMVLHFIFAFRYTVPDRYAFFLPFYCFAAIFIGLGSVAVIRKYRRPAIAAALLLLALLPVLVYFFTPAIARRYYKPLGQRRQRPYRDEYVYFLQPWKCGYNGAERFATEALTSIKEPNAVLYAYTTDVHALLYVQEVKGIRPDVRIVSDHDRGANAPVLDANSVTDLMKQSALYVVSPVKSYCPRFLLENYRFEKAGLVWKVLPK